MRSHRITLLLLASTTWAADPPEPLKLGSVTVSGSFRTRLEMWDFFAGNGDNQYAYSGNVLKVNLEPSRSTIDWTLELEAPFLLGLPSHAVAPAPQLQLGLGGNYYGAN